MLQSSAQFVYKYVLKFGPLRAITNAILLFIIPEKVILPEGILYLDPNDPVISGALTLGVFEVFEAEIIRGLVQPGMTVVDIGANIGYYTLIAARGVGPTGRVYAFEPEPVSRGILERNVRANGLANVSISAVAIADKKGELRLHVSKTNKGNHSIIHLASRVKEFTSSVNVQTDAFDDLCRREKMTHIDLIKIDVEGAETLVLQGMRSVLAQPRLTLLIEFYPDNLRQAGSDPVELLTLLTSYGFSLGTVNSKQRSIEPVIDFVAFVHSFSQESYTNLLCTKH